MSRRDQELIKRRFDSKRIVAWSIATTIVLILIYWATTPRPATVSVAKVRFGRFDQVIRAEGTLRSKDIHLLTAFANGRLGRLTLRPGDPVKEGQTITTLYWDTDIPVRSPINGVITRIFREAAAPIARAEPIVEIVDPYDLNVVVELSTSDAARLRIGAPMQVSFAEDQQPLLAKVSRISKAGYSKRTTLGTDEQRTEVIGELDAQAKHQLDRLGHNYHADVTILASTHENALSLPIGAVVRDGPAWSVFRVVEGRAVKTPITLAYKSATEVMVTNGLRGGDRVVVNPGDAVKDGAKIRAAD